MRSFGDEDGHMHALPLGTFIQPFMSSPMPNVQMSPAMPPMMQGPVPSYREERPIGMTPPIYERMDRPSEMQQMAILGGLPQSGQVMPAFCAQLLGGVAPEREKPDLRPPWMLQDLASAAIRELDSSNLPRNLLPEQAPVPSMPSNLPSMPANLPSMPANLPSMPANLPSMPANLPSMPSNLPSMPTNLPSMPSSLPPSSLPGQTLGNQSPLLTLQQQQLILQQLQNPTPQAQPQAIGFMQDLPGQQMPQFNQIRMQGMQNLGNLPSDLDPQLPLHDLEKNRQGIIYGGLGSDLSRMEDLGKGLLDLQGTAKGGKAAKPDELLGKDRGDLLPASVGKGKKGPDRGLSGIGPSGPSGREKGKSTKGGDVAFTTSGIGKMRYGNSPNKLFIGNLSLEVTSDDLVEALKPAGEVLGVRLRQGRYSSIAFAEFRHAGCVDLAVRTLQGLIIKGRPARMEFQSGKNDREDEQEAKEKDKGKGKKGRGKGGSKAHAAVIHQPGPVPPGPVMSREAPVEPPAS